MHQCFLKKNVDNISSMQRKILDNLEGVQDRTKKVLQEQEKDIVRAFNAKLAEIKKEIEDERNKKAENSVDFKEREQELNHHLELMTEIAQRIDSENRALIKKNAELKIEFKSQENDREILVKQLVLQKKDNTKLKHQIEEYKNIIEEKRQEIENSEEDSFEFAADEKKNNLDSKKVSTRTSKQNINPRSYGQISPQKPISRPFSKESLPFSNKHSSRVGTSYPELYRGNKASFHNRVNSTGVLPDSNPKFARYLKVIERLKKMIEMERKNLRTTRTLFTKDVESKIELEKVLRQCVEDVKQEVSKKRNENKVLYYANRRKREDMTEEEADINQQEREKIIEVLLSQERVLTLLYDKTFPPKSAIKSRSYLNSQGANLEGLEEAEFHSNDEQNN